MFLWSALAHLIALTSPGPDTAIVLRQVSLHGRIEGFKASLGIGIGIYIHCNLAVNGISIIIVSNELYKFLISLVGGTYIMYLGISMLTNDINNVSKENISVQTNKNSFLAGLVTNIFNVKAFLFFVSLFTILVDSINDVLFYIYPLYFAITSCLWFLFLSYVTTISKNKNFNVYSNKYISYFMSLVLCLISLLILIRAFYEYF